MEDLLIELFPDIKINGKAHMSERYFSVPLKNQWAHFPLDSISEREKKLISLLIAPEEKSEILQNNLWASFLLQDTSHVPSEYSEVQLLQFVLTVTNDEELFDEQLWLDAFKNTFDFIKEGFFLTKTYGVLVLSNPSHLDLHEEIDAVLNILDDDFAIRTSVYLGQYWSVDHHLPHIFAEEQQIFGDNHSSSKRTKISQLPEIALLHYSNDSTLKSPLLYSLKEKIKAIDGGPNLVVSMWNNQANISKAAADLFVHRNTLQYRLDRFFEVVGLNLKNMDDLLLGYLASISRIEEVEHK